MAGPIDTSTPQIPSYVKRGVVTYTNGVTLKTMPIPGSYLYKSFMFQVQGFQVGKTFTVHGSIDGLNFSPLGTDNFFITAPLTAQATPNGFIVKIELACPMPGGLQFVLNADSNADGTITFIMTDSTYNTSRQ